MPLTRAMATEVDVPARTSVLSHPADAAMRPASTAVAAPPTTNCGNGPSCTNGTAHAQDKCNGNGSCASGSDVICSPYACGPSACMKSCAGDLDCAATFVCDTGLATCISALLPKC